MKSAIFLSLFSLACIATEPTDTRYYYCKGDEIELQFFQLFDENTNLLDIEFDGLKAKIGQISVEDHRRHLVVKAWSKNKRTRFHLSLKKPKNDAVETVRRGVMDYRRSFEVEVKIKKSKHTTRYLARCEIFGLNNSFFEGLGLPTP